MINESWKKTSNTLVLRPDNFGDVLLSGPAMRALKNFGENRKITLLSSTMGSLIAGHMPEVDDVIVFNVPWVKTQSFGGSEQIKELVEELKERKFDSAVIFTNFSQNPLPTAMLCYLAGIPLVLGYCRENPYKLINTWVPDHEPFVRPKHSVERMLDLVGSIGVKTDDDSLKIAVPRDSGVKEKLSRLGVDLGNPWLLLHPGASENRRQYKAESYIEAAKILVKDFGFQIVVTGSAEESELANIVVSGIGKGAFSLAGKLNVPQLISLIDMAPLLISNNTGPVHIAAATQTPVVDLYARTNPEHTPWKVMSRVLYFDVPPEIRSKNTTLVHATPSTPSPIPTAQNIVSAVVELLNIRTYAKSFNTNSNIQSAMRFGRYFNEPLLPRV